MPLTSVERSAYVSQQQEYLATLRVGQFAKFLGKNPLFVTYFPVNQAMSRTDAGFGSAYETIGPQSPTRYNRVDEVPAFNMPDTIRPDVIRDEAGYDIEHELSDIAFIPGTVRPREDDYMLVVMAGCPKLLYRCTAFRHNSIQSNDYYMADFTLEDVDQDYIRKIEDQVVERYTCKFENIGTNNKVLVSDSEQAGFDELQGIIDTMTQFYKDTFFNEDVNGMLLRNYNAPYGTQSYYDNYVTRFINESHILENEGSDMTIALPYLELTPMAFDLLYKRTVLYAVQSGTTDYMSPYVYAFDNWIASQTSPLNLWSIPCAAPNLHCSEQYIQPDEDPPEPIQQAHPGPGAHCGWDGMKTHLRFYYSFDLQESLLHNAKRTLNGVENMIFDYLKRGVSHVVYDKKYLIETAFKADYFAYLHMPIVIYILKQVLADKQKATS